jgi:hypothetical protein
MFDYNHYFLIFLFKKKAIKCSTCLVDMPLKAYSQKFDQYYIELSSIDLNNNQSSQSIASVTNLLSKYTNLLFINTKTNQIQTSYFADNQIRLDEMFKFFYMDFTKLVDALSRLCCNANNFPAASDLLEANIKNLEFVYGGETQEHVEFAHEFFKLAEVQCNCGQFRRALANLEKAILIAEKFYSRDNQVLREFYELKSNIKNVL